MPIPPTQFLGATPTTTLAVVVTTVLLMPVAAATLVLTWHGFRGTRPGPAACMLLKLVELVLSHLRRR